jgi:hypothetical protein
MSESEKGLRLEQKGSEIKLVDFQVCPSCGKADGYVSIGRSRWGYCNTHKTKWLAGYDLAAAQDQVTEEQRRVYYDELGLGEFTHVYREELERQKRSAAADRVMSVFAFFRRRDMERETGLILAGQLIVDIPKGTEKPKRRQMRMIKKIVEQLTAEARSGRMPDDALIYGWPDGRRPADADETVDNDELMASWAKTRIAIAVRVDARNDGMVRIDSDLRRQMETVGFVRLVMTQLVTKTVSSEQTSEGSRWEIHHSTTGAHNDHRR